MAPTRRAPVHRVDKIAMALYAVSAASGLQTLIGGPVAQSTSLQLPPALIRVQAAAFLAGGLTAIAGRLYQRRRPDVGLGIEFGGDGLLSGATGIYLVAVYATIGPSFPPPVQIIAAFALGTLWRMWDIIVTERWLTRLSRPRPRHSPAPPPPPLPPDSSRARTRRDPRRNARRP